MCKAFPECLFNLSSLRRPSLAFGWLVNHCDPSPHLKDFYACVPRLLWQSCQTHTHTHTPVFAPVCCPLWYLVNIMHFPVCAADVCGVDRQKNVVSVLISIFCQSQTSVISPHWLRLVLSDSVCCANTCTHTHARMLRCVSAVARWMSGTHTGSDVEENSKSDLTDTPALLEHHCWSNRRRIVCRDHFT